MAVLMFIIVLMARVVVLVMVEIEWAANLG